MRLPKVLVYGLIIGLVSMFLAKFLRSSPASVISRVNARPD